MPFNYDILIIGGGPAGTKCAMELGKAGKKVGLIEKDAIGGVCLNRGCIPSKSYLYFVKMVEMMEGLKKAGRHGIEVGETRIMWENARKKKDLNVKMLGMGLMKSLERHGVEIIAGIGSVTAPHEMTVEQQAEKKTLTAEHIVLALGSKPLFLPIMPQGKQVISSTEILDLEKIPESLAIIGGGVTSVEMASVFSMLGTKVTVIEKLDTLLPGQDREITTVLKKSLEKRGCMIHLNTEVISCTDTEDKAEIVFRPSTPDSELPTSQKSLLVEKALIVIGRIPNYDITALEKVGIKHDGKYVALDAHFQTSLPQVYMIGDSAYQNLTAYGAEREAECVAAHILGKKKSMNYEHIPVTVFSHPEVAQIGPTEETLQKRNVNYEVKRSEYAANPKAIIMGEREGMVKVLVEKKTQKVLAVHMIGAHAADLIHQAILPVMQGITVEKWLEAVWSHPVLSEVVKSALES